MAGKGFQIRSFLTYWLDSVDEHSLHSPFFFDLYTGVLKATVPDLTSIETLRTKLREDKRTIVVHDLGSRSDHKKIRAISEIARTSLSPKKYSSLYYHIIHKYNHKTILELGTSLGINTLYLAAKKNSRVTTFEGAPEIASISTITFEFADAKNINLIEGNLDHTLADFLLTVKKIDFALLDANHTYEATIRYFKLLLSKVHEKTVIAIDDIHQSPAMEKAWQEILQHKLVYGSADLFRCGLLFFDPSLNKQHVILQF